MTTRDRTTGRGRSPAAAAGILLCVLAGAGSVPGAAAERTATVEVGKTKCLGIRRQVERSRVRVEPAAIARARLDRDTNRLCVEGRQRGTASVVFSGAYRRIVVGSDLREEERDFEETVAVRVVPPPPDVRRLPRVYTLEAGQERRVRLSIFMGPAFALRRDETERWRGLSVNVEPPGIARVTTRDDPRGRVMVEVTGLNPGRVRVELAGERRIEDDWQRVVRILEVSTVPPRRP